LRRPLPTPEEARVLEATEVATMPLVPEIQLHLITERCPLWRAQPDALKSLGLEAPYWAFCWPGGQALARMLLDHPELVRGRSVLDFGSGSAVEGLAALRAGARSVLAADLDPLAGVAARLNAQLGGMELTTTESDLVGQSGDWEVVLAGDVFYDRELATRGLEWLGALAARGATVWIGDPSRGFLDPRGLFQAGSFDCAVDGDVTGQLCRETVIYRVGPVRSLVF
jgi:predicted nicotinamide N-methyase